MKDSVIIIRYFSWLRLFPKRRELTYELCKRDSRAKDGWRVISSLGHLEAMDLIEENDMEQVVSNKYGTIWEGEMDLKGRRRKKALDCQTETIEESSEDIVCLDDPEILEMDIEQ